MGQVNVMVLLHNLTQLLAQEGNNLPDDFKDQVRQYYSQFEVMLGFLTYHEETDDGWILADEIGELAHRTNNAVDNHYRRYKTAEKEPFVLKVVNTLKLKKDIEGVIRRIGGLMSGTGSSSFVYDSRREKAVEVLKQSLPRTTMGWVADPMEEDAGMHCTQEDYDRVVDRLINKGPPENLDIIAIEGRQNMGINTFLKKVYNDASVVDHFESRVWVLVHPNEDNLKNLLLSILKDIMVNTPKEIYDMEVWELKREVMKELIDQRYLIVIEWVAEGVVSVQEFWNEKRDAFPQNKKGSRLILATNVSFEDYDSSCEFFSFDSFFQGGLPSYSKVYDVFQLQSPKSQDCWKLFTKKIFGEKECPEELEHLGRRIVQLCGLRPYIIVLMACILRVGEQTVSRWSNMLVRLESLSNWDETESWMKDIQRMLERLSQDGTPTEKISETREKLSKMLSEKREWVLKEESEAAERISKAAKCYLEVLSSEFKEVLSEANSNLTFEMKERLSEEKSEVMKLNSEGALLSFKYSIFNIVTTICYHEMPQHLKTCFLYFSVFPKNTEISVKQLIQLWIVEGLIQWVENDTNRQARSMEDVAEKDYLEVLIGLNLIQVTNRRSDGGPKSCRIHGDVWESCRRLSLEKEFVDNHYDSQTEDFTQPRRLSILKYCEQFLSASNTGLYDYTWKAKLSTSLAQFNTDDGADMIKLIKDFERESNIEDCHSILKSDNFREIILDIIDDYVSESNTSFFNHIRSFSCFSQDTQTVSEGNWESFFKHSKLLRVLNLGEEEVGKLPKAMEELFHLRYLKLKPAKNIVVPKSIFKLLNLQTIDLRTTRFPELPEGIWKMQQLRHLYLNGDEPNRLPIPESEDCTLPNLQTLSYISVDLEDGIHLFKKTPNLRKLGLYGYQCSSIEEQQVTFNLPHLQKLKFAVECNFEVPITLPDTITKISIVKRVHLEQNVIKMFGKLSNLQILKLVQTSFDDGELVFGEGSFPQLQFLKFEASNIATWRLEERAMPNLHHLVISKCPHLIEPPGELWKVDTLQQLDLSRASMEFANQVDDYLKKNEGIKLVVSFPLSSKSAA